MKLPAFSFAFLFAATMLHAQAPAGDGKARIIVDIKRVEVKEQQTPQFAVGNINDKRWRPKNWIEVDVEFDIKLPPEAGGRDGTFPAMQMNIYLALQHMTKDGKREVLQGTLDLINIPADGPCHALAYVSPATMKNIFQKNTVTASTDVQGWGVEVMIDGERRAQAASIGRDPWWEKQENFAIMSGMVLSKSKTPFAPLWGDYDVQVQPK
ncbi:Amuc_1102 family pilus-like protein [Prosthecobacter sp.]|jgi:hypothetical protein|uniref:Amuc_1102 family pilus-like protein n=1 Tax=Prosthecobacter sp. TaxID=1965333 RepID=UPI003784A35A